VNRVRAADDFKAIRSRFEELRGERRQQQFGDAGMPEQAERQPDAIAHVPRHVVRRYLAETRRSSSR
jgi:hypothetical protein